MALLRRSIPITTTTESQREWPGGVPLPRSGFPLVREWRPFGHAGRVIEFSVCCVVPPFAKGGEEGFVGQGRPEIPPAPFTKGGES